MIERKDTSIGQQAGNAIDTMAEPVKAVVDTVRDAMSTAVSGITAFVKEPGESMSRASRQADQAAQAVVRRAKPALPRARAAARTTARRASSTRTTKTRARATAKTRTRATAKTRARKGTTRRPASRAR